MAGWLAFALSLALGPVRARAQGSETTIFAVSVAMSPDVEPAAARVGSALRGALTAVPGASADAAMASYGGYDEPTAAHLARAREQLLSGRQAYLNLDLPAAIAQLTNAITEFDAAGAMVESPAELGDALLFLGAAQEFDGRSDDARRTFARMHVQLPSLAPDPDTFPPEVVARYEQSAPRDRASPQTSIMVESDPPGALVYVDFAPRGRTPLRVEGLMAGDHVVRVSRPGATPLVQIETTRRGREAGVNAILVDGPAGQALPDLVAQLPQTAPDSPDASAVARELGGLLAVNRMGVAYVSAGPSADAVHIELRVHDTRDGRVVGEASGDVPVATLEREVIALARPALERAVAPAVTRGGSTGGGRGTRRGNPHTEPMPGDDDDDEEDGALTEQWWFWAGIGGAVAVTAVVIIVVASGGDEDVGNDPGGQVVFEF